MLSEPIKTDILSRMIRLQFVMLLGLVFIGGLMVSPRLIITAAATSFAWGLVIVFGGNRGWWDPDPNTEEEKDDTKPSE